MPRSKITEADLTPLWIVLIENHMGATNIGTRGRIIQRLRHEWKIELSGRGLRQAFDQLNASQRIVCSTSTGTYIPTTDEEFERGYRYRHHMATSLLKGCHVMRAGWEAKKLERAAAQGDARPRGSQGALPTVVAGSQKLPVYVRIQTVITEEPQLLGYRVMDPDGTYYSPTLTEHCILVGYLTQARGDPSDPAHENICLSLKNCAFIGSTPGVVSLTRDMLRHILRGGSWENRPLPPSMSPPQPKEKVQP